MILSPLLVTTTTSRPCSTLFSCQPSPMWTSSRKSLLRVPEDVRGGIWRQKNNMLNWGACLHRDKQQQLLPSPHTHGPTSSPPPAAAARSSAAAGVALSRDKLAMITSKIKTQNIRDQDTFGQAATASHGRCEPQERPQPLKAQRRSGPAGSNHEARSAKNGEERRHLQRPCRPKEHRPVG